MAYLKVGYNKNADSLIHYCFQGMAPGDPVSGASCPEDEEGAKEAFKKVRDWHEFKGTYEAAHVIQSFSEEASKKISIEQANQVGQELMSRYWPNHQSLVFTHQEDGRFHNHIVVNTVNLVDGNLISKKYTHYVKLRRLSNEVLREAGIPNRFGPAWERAKSLPPGAQQAERARGASYLWHMKSEAKFWRAFATSFDEYAGYLRESGVSLRIKDKSITYFYEGQKRGKRADKLGKEFTHAGLVEAFRRNDEKFDSVVGLRQRIRDEVARRCEARGMPYRGPGIELRDPAEAGSAKAKDYLAFTPSSRATGDRCRPTDDKLRRAIIPIEAVRMAKGTDLLDYCARFRVKRDRDEQGAQRLKGRPYVVVDRTSWRNTKNQTRGGPIEFVAAHGRLSPLQAIARMNEMPGLLELEKHFGVEERSFRSYLHPDRQLAEYPHALAAGIRFADSFKADRNAVDLLLSSGQMQVRKNGVIQFFSKGDRKQALEYTENEQGEWAPFRRRPFRSPFLSTPGTGSKVVVFTEPRDLIAKRGTKLFDRHERSDGILGLFEPDAGVIEHHLKKNPGVKQLEIVTRHPEHPSPVELDLFGNLQTKLRGLGVQVKLTGFEQALRRKGPELSR